MNVLLNRIIFILSIVGIFIAAYVLQGYLRDIPLVCLDTGCEIVRKSPYSKLFNIPIPAYGLLGYFILTIIAFLRTISKKRELLCALLITAIVGFGFILYLTYLEIFVILALCSWCVLSAINMTVIFLLSIYIFLKERKNQKHAK